MSKEIKIGIIGCGNIIRAHFNGFKELKSKGLLDDITIKGLCDRDVDRASSFVKEGVGHEPFPGAGPEGDPMNQPHVWVAELQDELPEVFGDYKEMIEKTDINTVWICTPVFTHFEIAMYAMDKGLNVYLEKPMAVSVKAARKMVEKAEEKGLTLGIAESYHYGDQGRYNRWALDQGYIGDPTMSMMTFVGGFYSPDKIVGNTSWRHKKLISGGGITADACIHGFNVLRSVYGEVEYVSAETRALAKKRTWRNEDGSVKEEVDCETDDTMACIMTFENGMIHHQLQSWSGQEEPVMLGSTVFGTKGSFKYNSIVLNDGTTINLTEEFEKNASQEVKDKYFPHGFKDYFTLEIYDFLEAVKNGSQPETSGEDGLRDLALAFSVLEASYTGSRVKYTDVLEGKSAEYEAEINEHYNI